MVLYEYIIKLLMGNSGNVFMGLIVVMFGYFGWLLYLINDRLKELSDDKEKESYKINQVEDQLKQLDTVLNKDLLEKLNDQSVILERIQTRLENTDTSIDKYKAHIIAEIKEESEEIKEIMKILMGQPRNTRVKPSHLHEGDTDNKNNCK